MKEEEINKSDTGNVAEPSLLNANFDIERLMSLPKEILPKYYANGFLIGNSLSDATIVAQLGTTPIAIFTISFAALKSLHKVLGESINTIEKGMGQSILDNNELLAQWTKNLKEEKIKR